MNTDPDDDPPNIRVFNPPVQITEERRNIQIIVSLPGVTEEQIRIEHGKENLLITIHDGKTIRQKEIVIPQAERIVKKRFFDGVLDITLEKSRPGFCDEG